MAVLVAPPPSCHHAYPSSLPSDRISAITFMTSLVMRGAAVFIIFSLWLLKPTAGADCRLEYRMETVRKKDGTQLDLVWVHGLDVCLSNIRCVLEDECRTSNRSEQASSFTNAVPLAEMDECLVRECTFNASKAISSPLELPKKLFFPLEPSDEARSTMEIIQNFISSLGSDEEAMEAWEKIGADDRESIRVPFWAFILMCILVFALALASLVLLHFYFSLKRNHSFSLMEGGVSPQPRVLSYSGFVSEKSVPKQT